jgi:hypothetical protein
VLSSAATRILLTLALLIVPVSAIAQTPEPPGPYVIDVRGTTMGIPNNPAFFPPLASGTAVPARGFGFDTGVHVYPVSLGVARVGVGANVLYARGHIASSDVTSTVRMVAPQLSFNFGTRQGWSYLSAGYGGGSLRSDAPLVVDASSTAATGAAVVSGGSVNTGRIGAVNLGGGARWFLSGHAALGLDVRFHRLSATATTPRVTLVSVSVGLSLR